MPSFYLNPLPIQIMVSSISHAGFKLKWSTFMVNNIHSSIYSFFYLNHSFKVHWIRGKTIFFVNVCSSKALFTREILTHNIAIKRYCDKNTIFIQYFFSCVNWKYLFLWNVTTIFWQKNVFLSFYCNSFFYLNIVCKNIVCE